MPGGSQGGSEIGRRDDDLLDRPTLLMVGSGDDLEASLRRAFDAQGLFVEQVALSHLQSSVQMTGPDVILLVGDASHRGGAEALERLESDGTSNQIPVVLLAEDALTDRVSAYRRGATAIIPRRASAREIARRVVALAGDRTDDLIDPSGEVFQGTFEDLLRWVQGESRNGILTVRTPYQTDRPVRIVLGGPRGVQEVLRECKLRLAPAAGQEGALLSYQFHLSPGGPLEVGVPAAGRPASPDLIAKLRALIVDDEQGRGETIAEVLRAGDAQVFVTDIHGIDLEPAAGLDPQVVLVDATALEGPAFDAVAAIRRDLRLRWGSILVLRWGNLFGGGAVPSLEPLAAQVRPMLEAEQALRRSIGRRTPFDFRMETIGPSRLLRVVTESGVQLHLSVQGPGARVELDLAAGLVVGAKAWLDSDEMREGSAALATLLAFRTGRVRAESRDRPPLANIMSPVEDALAAAAAVAGTPGAGEALEAKTSVGGPFADEMAKHAADAPSPPVSSPPVSSPPVSSLGGPRTAAGPVVPRPGDLRPREPAAGEGRTTARPPRLAAPRAPSGPRWPAAPAPRPPAGGRPSAPHPAAGQVVPRAAADQAVPHPAAGQVAPRAAADQAVPRPPRLPASMPPFPTSSPLHPAASVRAPRLSTAEPVARPHAFPGAERPFAARPPAPAASRKGTLLGVPGGPGTPSVPAPPPVQPASSRPIPQTVLGRSLSPAGAAGSEEIELFSAPFSEDEATTTRLHSEAPKMNQPPHDLDAGPPAMAPAEAAPAAHEPPHASGAPSTVHAVGVGILFLLSASLGLVLAIVAPVHLEEEEADGVQPVDPHQASLTRGAGPAPEAAHPEAHGGARHDPGADHDPGAGHDPGADQRAHEAGDVHPLDSGHDADRAEASSPGTAAASEGAAGEARFGDEEGDAADLTGRSDLDDHHLPPSGGPHESEVDHWLSRARHAHRHLAARIYRRILDAHPHEHHAAYGLARILMGRGEAAEAAELMEIAVGRRPRRAVYWVLLGDARRRSGDRSGARRAYRRAYHLAPSHPQVRARLRHAR